MNQSLTASVLNYIDLRVLELHGKMKQAARTNRFFEFVNAKEGVLICTDVAARGLDVPEVYVSVLSNLYRDDPLTHIQRLGYPVRSSG